MDEGFLRASRNIHRLDVLPTIGANVYDILNHDVLAITTAGVEGLKQRLERTLPSASADSGSGSSTRYSEEAAATPAATQGPTQQPSGAPPDGGDGGQWDPGADGDPDYAPASVLSDLEATITRVQQPNPKTPGSATRERYENYRVGMTLREALNAGLTLVRSAGI